MLRAFLYQIFHGSSSFVCMKSSPEETPLEGKGVVAKNKMILSVGGVQIRDPKVHFLRSREP